MESSLINCQKEIVAGNVVVLPTETCYGISCDATNSLAVQEVFRIKERDIGKPLSIMVSGMNMAKQYVAWSQKIDSLWRQYLPGPYTLILPLKDNVSFPFVDRTVGIRCPNYSLLTDMIRDIGIPIVSTSANVAGRPQCYSFTELKSQIDIDRLAAYYDIGKLEKRPPSTLVFLEEDKIRIVKRV